MSITYIPLFEYFTVSRKKLIKRIYEELNDRKITSKFYDDEYWLGVDEAIKAINYACEEFHCTCVVTVKDGGYKKNSDSSGKRKEYNFEILDENKIAIAIGVIICSAAGTLEDPFSRYDITVNM